MVARELTNFGGGGNGDRGPFSCFSGGEGKREPETRPNSLPIFVLLSRICVTHDLVNAVFQVGCGLAVKKHRKRCESVD
jgi:hypothetical protein